MNNGPGGSLGELDGVHGALRVLCFFLTFVFPFGLLGIIVVNAPELVSHDETFSQFRILLMIDTVICFFLIIFSYYADIGLRRRKKNAVPVAGRFLIVFALSQFLMGVLLGSTEIPKEFSRYAVPGGFENPVQSAMPGIIFAVGWYVYLKKSMRVRITYKLPGNTLQKTSLWDYIKVR